MKCEFNCSEKSGVEVVVMGMEVGGVLRGEVGMGSVTEVVIGAVVVAVESGSEIGELWGEG